MLFKALEYLKQNDAKNPKQFHPKNIPLQIRSLGTRDFFWSPAHKINCRKFSFFDTAEKGSVVMNNC